MTATADMNTYRVRNGGGWLITAISDDCDLGKGGLGNAVLRNGGTIVAKTGDGMS